MKTKKILFIVLISVSFLPALSNLSLAEEMESKIYILDLNYNKENLVLVNLSVKKGYAPGRKIQPETGYSCEVVSFLDEVLYSFKFEIPVVVYPPPPLSGEGPGEPIYLETVDFTLLIPFFENGKVIDIYDSSRALKLSVDVSKFTEFCGNHLCQGKENPC